MEPHIFFGSQTINSDFLKTKSEIIKITTFYHIFVHLFKWLYYLKTGLLNLER